jgi:hypothetical protein
MAESCYNAKYLVLHFVSGKLESTKVCYSWRGAQMSKRNHERMFKMYPHSRYDACTRIVPIEAVLAIPGMERVDTKLNPDDADLLRKMGIES